MTEVVIPLPIWLDERTVALRWGVSFYTVQRIRKGGDLKAKRIGCRWKYREDWLREYEDKATPCQSSLELENGFSTGGQIARTGAPANSIQQLDRHAVHLSAQAIFKSPKSGLQRT